MTNTFARESDMAAPATSWLKARGLLVKSEFVSPWGICDLVGVRFNQAHVAHRLGYEQTKRVGSITRAALLLEVPDVETGKSITLKRMVRDCSPAIREEVVVKEMERLETDGFVRRGPRGRLQKLNGWVPLQEMLVAVELKLSRIEEAMQQARMNLGFADHSYVGLPAEVARRVASSATRWGKYFDDGIGLLSVSKARCRVLIPARKTQTWTDEAIQLYCVDKFWRGRIKGS